MDHAYDAFSEFPDGRLTVPIGGEYSLGAPDFARDIPFVLDSIEDLAAGRNPDADGKPLPAGRRGGPDPRRIGMFGTSKGGTATAVVMGMDQRVRAGLSLDAPVLSAYVLALSFGLLHLDRPDSAAIDSLS